MNKERIKNKKRLLLPLAVASLFLLGIESGGFQLTLINIAATFKLNNAMAGFMVTAHYAAASIMPLIFGRISDRVGKKRIIIIFSSVVMIGCVVSIFSKVSGVFVLGIIMIGGGFGVSECLYTAAVSDSDPINAEKKINLMQAAFSFGAFISPILTTCLMDSGASWRIVFILVGAGIAVIFPVLILTRFETARSSSEVLMKRMRPQDLFKSKILLLLFLLIIAYAGLECGIAYFTVSYFTIELRSPTFGAYSLSCFWLAMMVSRLAFSRIKVSSLRIVYIFYAVISAVLFTVVLSNNHILALLLFIMAGLFFGPIWPVIVATGTKTFPNESGTVASILMTGSAGGASLFPYLSGLLADAFGFRYSFGFLALISLLASIPILRRGLRTRSPA